MTFCLLSCAPNLFLNGVYSKRKEFALKAGLLSEGRQNNFDIVFD